LPRLLGGKNAFERCEFLPLATFCIAHGERCGLGLRSMRSIISRLAAGYTQSRSQRRRIREKFRGVTVRLPRFTIGAHPLLHRTSRRSRRSIHLMHFIERFAHSN